MPLRGVHPVTVDGREVIRCGNCRLVQFKRENEICVKCKQSYAPPAPVTDTEQQVGSVDPSATSGERTAAPSALPHLAMNVRQFRLDLGLSQRDLASRMGIPRTWISK